jgi:putative ABC transport system ATP-binding protein
MIEFKHVSVNRSGLPVLTDFSMHVPKGGMALIFGGSGSGKSTICDLILGRLSAQAGEVRINDSQNREKIGAISPSLELLDDRTVRENIRLPLEIAGVNSKRQEIIVEALLDRFALHSVANERPSTLSGSTRQKTAIARAVVSEPFILIADEPTLHLDQAASKEIADILLKEQARGMTMVVLTSSREFRDSFPNASQIALEG